MELKDFVAQTLTQICQGIALARTNTEDMKAIIAPRTDQNNAITKLQDSSGHAQAVHFEVLLVNQEDASSEGGLKVAGGVFSLGGQISSVDSVTNTHKISFDIPLAWPELKRGYRS